MKEFKTKYFKCNTGTLYKVFSLLIEVKGQHSWALLENCFEVQAPLPDRNMNFGSIVKFIALISKLNQLL